MPTDNITLTETEHLPIINEGIGVCQKCLEECGKAERCNINVSSQYAKLAEQLAFLQKVKDEFFPTGG